MSFLGQVLPHNEIHTLEMSKSTLIILDFRLRDFRYSPNQNILMNSGTTQYINLLKVFPQSIVPVCTYTLKLQCVRTYLRFRLDTGSRNPEAMYDWYESDTQAIWPDKWLLGIYFSNIRICQLLNQMTHGYCSNRLCQLLINIHSWFYLHQ